MEAASVRTVVNVVLAELVSEPKPELELVLRNPRSYCYVSVEVISVIT